MEEPAARLEFTDEHGDVPAAHRAAALRLLAASGRFSELDAAVKKVATTSSPIFVMAYMAVMARELLEESHGGPEATAAWIADELRIAEFAAQLDPPAHGS